MHAHAHAHTPGQANARAHTHKYLIFIAFPRKQCFANAPHCYVIRELSVCLGNFFMPSILMLLSSPNSKLYYREVITKRVKEWGGPTSGVFVPLSPCTPNYTPGHDVQELKARLWEGRPLRVTVECSDIRLLGEISYLHVKYPVLFKPCVQ